ncbi:MAG: hypothetical protein CUN56_17230, partial [Phototrophicales bacterium]
GNAQSYLLTLTHATQAPSNAEFRASTTTTSEGGTLTLSWNVPSQNGIQILMDFPDLLSGGQIITNSVQPNTRNDYTITVPSGVTRVRYTLLDAAGHAISPN